MSHLHRRRRFRGARHRVGLQNAGVTVAGALAGNDAQAKALGGVKGSGLQPAIVPGEALGAAVLDEQFAVVCAFGGVGEDGEGGVPIHLGGGFGDIGQALGHGVSFEARQI